jgi:hypothetical protein
VSGPVFQEDLPAGQKILVNCLAPIDGPANQGNSQNHFQYALPAAEVN